MARIRRKKATPNTRAKKAPQRREPCPSKKTKNRPPSKGPSTEPTPTPTPAPEAEAKAKAKAKAKAESESEPEPDPVLEEDACNHKNFPNQVIPATPDKPLFALEYQSYSASLLLRQTVEEYRCNAAVRDIHTRVKRRFVKLYTDYIDPTAPIDDQIWHASRIQLPAKRKFLQEMMDLLDESFFFGTLTGAYGGRASPLVSLFLDPGSRSNYLGMTSRPDYSIFVPCSQITIHNRVPWPYSDGNSHCLSLMVETLLHEMVHAYLILFVCTAKKCERNILNTLGLTGHSHTWKALHAVIVREIRGWDPLSWWGFRADVCTLAEYCVTSCNQELEEQTRQRDVSARLGRRPMVKPARTQVVRFSQTGRVMVKLGPRAKKRQAWLRARERKKRRMWKAAREERRKGAAKKDEQSVEDDGDGGEEDVENDVGIGVVDGAGG